MEPTICKPGAYKSTGVYNGAGGVYNGRGVYNDGAEEFVEIGGYKYPFVKIGNLYWITYNLDYKFSGLNVGNMIPSNSPYACYYGEDEAVNGWNGRKNGLLYNWYAANYLEQNKNDLLPAGWRVPNENDIDYLFSFVSNNPSKLKSLDLDWFSGWNGDNTTGFNAFPSGRWGIYPTPNFNFLGTDFYMFTCSEHLGVPVVCGIETMLWKDTSNYKKQSSASLRLCKDT